MRDGRSRAGFTIIEVVVTMAVLVVGILVIVSSFSMNLRESTQSRERLMADVVLENLVEEVLAHSYGDGPSASWANGEKSFEFIVEGRAQQTRITQNVAQAPDGNGSFFGKSEGDIDRVTLSVEWQEASGVGGSAQSRSLSVDLTVRRLP